MVDLLLKQITMTHLETELKELKEEVLKMMNLILSQFYKSKESLLNFDQEIALEIISNERRINAYEIKIDTDCENILALFNPVAIDLRFVLAVLKINSNLERIGDNAEGIAKYILNFETATQEEFLNTLKVKDMLNITINMIENVIEAFDKENTQLARKVFLKDKTVNEINQVAASKTVELINKFNKNVDQLVYLLSVIRKLERVGDLTKNIAEEIIFYIEAKVLKHKPKVKKQ